MVYELLTKLLHLAVVVYRCDKTKQKKAKLLHLAVVYRPEDIVTASEIRMRALFFLRQLE